MGLFDSVNIKCEKCGETYEHQTKVDDCVLQCYDIKTAPPMIKAELAKYGSDCDHCGHHNTFTFDSSEFCQYDVEGMVDEIGSYLHNDLGLILSDGSMRTIRNIIMEKLG